MDWQLVVCSVIPMVVMILCGVVALYREPGPKLQSFFLHLAAGVIFAVVAVEFLPDLMKHPHNIAATGGGFIAGTIAMLVIRELTEGHGHGDGGEEHDHEHEKESGIPAGMLFAIAVDLAIDGLMLGIGFVAGVKEGILLTFALAIELASLGLATTSALRKRKIGVGKTLAVVVGLALLFGLCGVAGGFLLQSLTGNALSALLAFGSAALLFLVTEELLSEAHETPETPLLTSAFFIGFIALFLIEMAGKAGE